MPEPPAAGLDPACDTVCQARGRERGRRTTSARLAPLSAFGYLLLPFPRLALLFALAFAAFS
jgi:hypothetical protein